jgi:response regulator NasT
MRSLTEAHGNPVFDAQPSPTVVLDDDFVIHAANRAYLAVSGRAAEDLLGSNIFEAFPDNPDDPEADGSARLNASLERVVKSGRVHNMLIQRYDVSDPSTGQWTRKFWAPVNAPIRDGDRTIGVMHRVEDITPLHQSLDRVLDRYGALLTEDQMTDGQADEFVEAATSFVASAKDYRELLHEVTHLRRALTSRATIDQAKGVLMAERRCSAEAAFGLLARLSQDTNVRVADVAAALVYQAQRGAA